MPKSITASQNPLLAFAAFFVIGPWKLRTAAYTRVFSALCPPYEAICLAFSIIAAKSGNHGFNTWIFIFYEVLGFPLLWLLFAKPLTLFWKKYGRKVVELSEHYIGSSTRWIAEGLATAPGTSWLWSKSGSSSLLFGLVSVVLALCAAVCSLYTGWLVEAWLEPHGWDFIASYTRSGVVHTIVTFVSYLIGLNVAYFLGTVLISAEFESKEKGNGLIVSILVALASSHYIATLIAPLYGTAATWGAVTLLAVVFNFVVYPLVACIAANGMLKRIIDALRPVFDNFYSATNEDDVAKAYRDLFQQVVNIALTAYIGWQCFAILAGFDLNACIVWVGTLFLGAFAYCLGGVTLNHRWGNGFCNAVIAVAVGITTFFHTGFLHSSLGGYGDIILGVIAAVVSFGFVVPLVYAGIGKVLSLPVLSLVTKLGTGLRIAHSFINEHTFDRVYRASLWIYHECYRAETPTEKSYERVVMHLTNLVLALTLGVLVFLGLTTAVTSWLLVTVPLSAVVFLLAYSLLGQVVMAGKAPLSGTLAGFYAAAGVAGYLTPNHVFDLQYSLLVAGVSGLLVIVFFYPLFYAGVQKVTGGWMWGLEEPLDNTLNAATKKVAAPLLAAWHGLAEAWSSLMTAFNSMLGRKSI